MRDVEGCGGPRWTLLCATLGVFAWAAGAHAQVSDVAVPTASTATPASSSPAPNATPLSAPLADETAVAPVSRPAPARWLVHLNVGMPVFTYVGAWTNPLNGNVASSNLGPGDRFVLLQLVGIGYWVHPHIRLNLTLQLAETLTSQSLAMPPGASTLTGMTFMGGIAWAAFTAGPFFAGAGLLVGPRWLGNSVHNWWYGDAGIFTCLGLGLPLGNGWTLGAAVQVPITFNPAVIVSVSPALFGSYRF